MKKIILAILISAAIIGVCIGMYHVGYTAGKDHTIYTQEIYTDPDGYIVVIDGEVHNYN